MIATLNIDIEIIASAIPRIHYRSARIFVALEADQRRRSAQSVRLSAAERLRGIRPRLIGPNVIALALDFSALESGSADAPRAYSEDSADRGSAFLLARDALLSVDPCDLYTLFDVLI